MGLEPTLLYLLLASVGLISIKGRNGFKSIFRRESTKAQIERKFQYHYSHVKEANGPESNKN